jgi:hypothetical protein
MSFPPTDLFSAIGLYIVNFGTLEYLTSGYLYDHLPEEEYTRVEKQHFTDRVEKVLSHISAFRQDSATLKAITNFRRKLAPLRDLRNNIAHGYLLVKTPDQGMPSLIVANPRIQSLPRATSSDVTLQDIFRALKELDDATEILKSLLGYRDEIL